MTAPRRGLRAAALALAVLSGATLAVQSRLNGELGRRLGDGVLAALVSFGGGFVLLLALAAALRPVRRGVGRVRLALRTGRLRPWQVAGGVAGAYLVGSQAIVVPLIGVAVFTIAVVAGQAASSLAVDRAGLAPGAPRAITPARVAGAVLALAAVALAVSDRLGSPSALLPAVLPALAGLAVSWQLAVNGHVAATATAPGGAPLTGALPAALVNFGAGTAALVAAAAVSTAVRGLPATWPAEPLLYAGGALGIVVIGGSATAVPVIGVLLVALATVAGQLVGAVALDLLVPADADGLAPVTVAGAALTLVAVAVAGWPARRPRAPSLPG